MYREQTYVERCQCNEPAIGPCASCGRARCAAHLERGLCNRCTQWIGRELDQRANGRWIASTALGVVLTLGLLVSGVVAGILIALPVSVGTYFAMRGVQRGRLVRRMGPALAASKGELPAPDRTRPEPPSTTTGLPPGAGPRF